MAHFSIVCKASTVPPVPIPIPGIGCSRFRFSGFLNITTCTPTDNRLLWRYYRCTVWKVDVLQCAGWGRGLIMTYLNTLLWLCQKARGVCDICWFAIDTDTGTETGQPGSRFQILGIVAALMYMHMSYMTALWSTCTPHLQAQWIYTFVLQSMLTRFKPFKSVSMTKYNFQNIDMPENRVHHTCTC